MPWCRYDVCSSRSWAQYISVHAKCVPHERRFLLDSLITPADNVESRACPKQRIHPHRESVSTCRPPETDTVLQFKKEASHQAYTVHKTYWELTTRGVGPLYTLRQRRPAEHARRLAVAWTWNRLPHTLTTTLQVPGHKDKVQRLPGRVVVRCCPRRPYSIVVMQVNKCTWSRQADIHNNTYCDT